MHPVEEYQDIITLTVDGLNECEIVTLAGRGVGVKLLYNPGEDTKSVSWRSDELVIRGGRENQHPERLGPQEQPRRETSQYVAVLFGLQLPLIHDPFNKV